MKHGDRPSVNVEAIPTGALALDVALGVGGIPRGRIIEIYDLKAPVKLLWLNTSLLNAKKRRYRSICRRGTCA